MLQLVATEEDDDEDEEEGKEVTYLLTYLRS
jgi:hypothetical protein